MMRLSEKMDIGFKELEFWEIYFPSGWDFYQLRKEKISKSKVLKTQVMKIMLYIKFSKKKKKNNTKIKVVEHIESENSN